MNTFLAFIVAVITMMTAYVFITEVSWAIYKLIYHRKD